MFNDSLNNEKMINNSLSKDEIIYCRENLNTNISMNSIINSKSNNRHIKESKNTIKSNTSEKDRKEVNIDMTCYDNRKN